MNFEQARDEWESIAENIDQAAIQAQRVLNDPLPINTEDVAVMQRCLADIQARLERLHRGLS